MGRFRIVLNGLLVNVNVALVVVDFLVNLSVHFNVVPKMEVDKSKAVKTELRFIMAAIQLVPSQSMVLETFVEEIIIVFEVHC